MRVLKLLLSSIVLCLVIAATGFFIGREVLLLLGVSKVKASLTQLASLSVNNGAYVGRCREKGASTNQAPISSLQLRFLNSSDYVVEIICSGFQLDPIVIESVVLPPLVTKEPGTGGIIWGEDLSAVTLEVLGRKQALGVQDREVVSTAKAASTGITPQTTCAGRGYSCCIADSQFGTGQLQSQVTDCLKSCYATCLPRPVILSFSSDPVSDSQTRTVAIAPNQTVSFAYVVSYDVRKPLTVTLDYGDGQVETLTTLSGKADHLYTCNVGICNYTAHLTLQAADQITSAPTPLSQMTIRVQP